MDEIVLTTPSSLRQLLKEAVAEGVASALARLERGAYLNEAEAAKYLDIPANTLRQWRALKRGPKYIKAGKSVRYAREELDAWMKDGETLTLDAVEAGHGKAR